MNKRTALFLLALGLLVAMGVIYDLHIGNPGNWMFSEWEGRKLLTENTYALVGFGISGFCLVLGIIFAVRGDS
jgi:hypothetical protein